MQYPDAWYHIRDVPKFTVSGGVDKLNREIRWNKKIKKHVVDLKAALDKSQEQTSFQPIQRSEQARYLELFILDVSLPINLHGRCKQWNKNVNH